MTEAEWRDCSDPEPMLEFLQGAPADRKLRLFACACCRRVVRLSEEEGLVLAVMSSERYADGLASLEEMSAAWKAADSAEWVFNRVISEQVALAAVERATKRLAPRNCARACLSATEASVQERAWLPWERRSAVWWSGMRASVEKAVADERRVQADLLRCIVGNPFRPIAVSSHWLTPDVLDLARSIFEDREFDRLPDLSDALEDSGCSDSDILSHCRGRAIHARGCWVVDRILGRD